MGYITCLYEGDWKNSIKQFYNIGNSDGNIYFKVETYPGGIIIEVNNNTTPPISYYITNPTTSNYQWKTTLLANASSRAPLTDLNPYGGPKSFIPDLTPELRANQYLIEVSIDHFGTGLGLNSLSYAFNNCYKLRKVSTDWGPDVIQFMNNMFDNAQIFNQNITTFPTSNAVFMNNMFLNAFMFNNGGGNNPLNWNVSSVQNMNGMFYNAYNFNQSLSSWNVQNVRQMQDMFINASSFNQSLGSWDIRNASNMKNMFVDLRDLGTPKSYNSMTDTNYDNTLNGWGNNAASWVASRGSNLINVFTTNCLIYSANGKLGRDKLTSKGMKIGGDLFINQTDINLYNGVIEVFYTYQKLGEYYDIAPAGNYTLRFISDISETYTTTSSLIVNQNQIKFTISNFPTMIFPVTVTITDTTNFMYFIGKLQNDAACFNEGTKILCLNNNLEEYIPIEHLRKGDLVKSYKHGYKKIDLIGKNVMLNNPKKWDNCMYKMEKTESNELTEDLIVTGGHSILVDSMTTEEKVLNDELFGLTPLIDNKYLLLSSVSRHFKPLQDEKLYTYYHFVLENDNDDEARYGVWANGILTEIPSKEFFIKQKFILL